MTDVTVSIVNHENRDAVLASLDALEADAGRRSTLQLIVVDNASTDGSVEAIRAAHPGVEIVARADRAGYGANHNHAIAVAAGRHVLVLNDDAIVQAGAIDVLAAHLDSHPRDAVACPRVQRPDGELEQTLWPRPSLRLDLAGSLRPGHPPRAGGANPIGWATGCALMARRDALVAVGGFDEGYFMYSEEIDLCTRLLDAGHGIASVREAVVVHEGQVSTGLTSPERAIEMARSRRRYWRQHYGPVSRRAAQVVVGAQFASLALAAALRRRPARPFLLQAVGCFGDPWGNGLRERADAFNRS